MFKNGRHYNCLYILSLQYGLDIRPAIRSNIDVVFIFREHILKNRKSLYDNYAGIIPDFTLFCQLMDALTEDYHCLVIFNQGTSNNWCDSVYYWKATIPPDDWKFGCEDYWKFHEKRYDMQYTENPLR